jgi:hypothetical protein
MKNKRIQKAAMLLAIAGLTTLSITSCTDNEKEAQLKNQEVSIQKMKSALASKETEFNEVLNLMNKVEGQVASIVSKHDLIAATEIGNKKENKDKLLKELDLIGNLVNKSNETIGQLNGRMKNSELKMNGFQRRIDLLMADLEKRSSLIIDLRDQIQMKDEQFQLIAGLYDSVQIQSANQVRMINNKEQELELLNGLNKELNTVRYAVGSYRNLKDRGLVNKEGGFLGLGRTIDINGSAGNDEYVKIDIREFQTLPIEASKVELISEHPSDSYVIIQDENETSIKHLEITDPKRFWKNTKYLVISTKS